MDSTAAVGDLPDGVLVKIFSYLTCHDLINMQKVCQRWSIVTQYSELWSNMVYFPRYSESDVQIETILQHTPHLKYLCLKNRHVGHSVMYGFLKYCPKLQKVEFNTRQIISAKFLDRMLQKCPDIEYLHLPIEGLRTEECSKVVARFHNLRTLSVGDRGDFYCVLALRPLGYGCPALQHLNLVHGMPKYNDLEYFLEKKKDQLISLTIGWICADFQSTIPLLVICNALKTLRVDWFENARDSHHYLILPHHYELFSRLHSVTSLTFSELNDIHVDDLISIFSNGAMRQLKELQIVEYRLYKDVVCKSIVENCPKLQRLHFIKCSKLSEVSVESLCFLSDLEDLSLEYSGRFLDDGMESISKCENLKYLDLSWCYLKRKETVEKIFSLRNLKALNLSGFDVSVLDWHRFPSHFQHLSVLTVTSCVGVDHSSLVELKVAMPQLLIKD